MKDIRLCSIFLNNEESLLGMSPSKNYQYSTIDACVDLLRNITTEERKEEEKEEKTSVARKGKRKRKKEKKEKVWMRYGHASLTNFDVRIVRGRSKIKITVHFHIPVTFKCMVRRLFAVRRKGLPMGSEKTKESEEKEKEGGEKKESEESLGDDFMILGNGNKHYLTFMRFSEYLKDLEMLFGDVILELEMNTYETRSLRLLKESEKYLNFINEKGIFNEFGGFTAEMREIKVREVHVLCLTNVMKCVE